MGSDRYNRATKFIHTSIIEVYYEFLIQKKL